MALNDLDVCNQAIAKGGGGEKIDALDAETALGAFCLENYPRKKAFLLAKHRWIFAKEIVQLTRLSETPANCPMAYAYARPADVAGAFHDFRAAALENSAKVAVSQASDFIASDSPEVWTEYTKVVPESRWEPWFEQLVVTAFAVEVAHIALKRTLAGELYQEAFGSPEMHGAGGLFLQAKQDDSRNAPQRALAYEAGGPLVSVRSQTGSALLRALGG